MRQPYHPFTSEFKQEAVQPLETNGKSGIQVAEDLGVDFTCQATGIAQ